MSRLFPQVSPPEPTPADEDGERAEAGNARVFLLKPQDVTAASGIAVPDERAHKVAFAVRNVIRPVAFALIGATIGLIYGFAFFG
ncbi:MAG: hypothetical protein AB7K86_25050 [Rhodospirillales bacterium]